MSVKGATVALAAPIAICGQQSVAAMQNRTLVVEFGCLEHQQRPNI